MQLYMKAILTYNTRKIIKKYAKKNSFVKYSLIQNIIYICITKSLL